MLPAKFAATLDADTLFVVTEFVTSCEKRLGLTMTPVCNGVEIKDGELLDSLYDYVADMFRETIAQGGMLLAQTRVGAIILNRFDSSRIEILITGGPNLGAVTIEEATPVLAALLNIRTED